MTKTAYVPVELLPIIQELQDNFEIVEKEVHELNQRYGSNDKFKKVVLGGRNLDQKGKDSYYGKIINIGLLLDPIVLDATERVISFGENDVHKDYKLALIKSRRESTTWLNQWITRNESDLAHISLFIMYPGAKITPHYGVNDSFVRVHLGIQTPPEVMFFTEYDEPRKWERNKTFGFLDYEVKHWVEFAPAEHNNPRIILDVDVRRSYYEKYYPGLLESALGELNA